MKKEELSHLMDKIIKHKEQEGLSFREIALKIGVVEASLVRWVKGKCIPHYSSLNLIYDYLNEIGGKKNAKLKK